MGCELGRTEAQPSKAIAPAVVAASARDLAMIPATPVDDVPRRTAAPFASPAPWPRGYQHVAGPRHPRECMHGGGRGAVGLRTRPAGARQRAGLRLATTFRVDGTARRSP